MKDNNQHDVGICKLMEAYVIIILCSGSRGDIQPYIALAQELISLGKKVRIATGASF
jgi:UDP:flavonoid glycosyltransferase YjiC (YdhE family)